MMIFLVLALLLVAPPAWAETYWVSATGGSTASVCGDADGSSDPGVYYRAINDVINDGCLASGTNVVKVKPVAAYVESLSNPPSNTTFESSDPATKFILNPSSGSRAISFTASRSKVVFRNIRIRMLHSGSDACFLYQTGFSMPGMIVEDFECEGPPSAVANRTGAGFKVFGKSANGILVRRGKIFNWRGPDPCPDGVSCPGVHGFYYQVDNGTIENLEITNVDGYCIQFYNNGGANIAGNIWRKNHCHHTVPTSGVGGSAAMHIQANSSNNTIVDNTFWQTGRFQLRGSGNKVINNSFYLGAQIQISGTNCTLSNNIIIVTGTPITGDTCATQQTNRTSGTATAIWEDPANGNFALKAGSAAIDAGTAQAGFVFNGSARDQGAHETFGFASGTVSGNEMVLNFGMNLNTPLVPGSPSTDYAVNNGRTVTGVEATGATQITLTFDGAACSGESWTFSYTPTSGSITDSAKIGNQRNQHSFAITDQAVTNECGGASITRVQSRFRFEQVRGTEAAPVVIAAENTSVTLPKGAAFRLRLKFRTDDDPVAANYKLQVDTDAAGYLDIPDVMGAELISWYGNNADPDIVLEGTTVTEQLTSDEATNISCATVRSSQVVPTLDFNNSETECLFFLQISNSAAVGTTYDFRIAGLETYTVTPRVTVGPYVAGSGF